jgi:hypothetical protein
VAFARSGKPPGKPENNPRSQRFLKPGGIGMSEGIFRPSAAGLPQEMLDAERLRAFGSAGSALEH